MKIYAVFVIMFVIISLSCCEKGGWKDEDLTLHRQNYIGDELRLDGYYYTQFRDIYRIYFLYHNGIVLSGGDIYIKDVAEYKQKYKDGSFWREKRSNKRYWGVFVINSDKIKIEKWYPSSKGGMPVFLHSGKILNDTTFIMTKSIRSSTGEEKALSEVYHFKELQPKPDSTNSFIK